MKSPLVYTGDLSPQKSLSKWAFRELTQDDGGDIEDVRNLHM